MFWQAATIILLIVVFVLLFALGMLYQRTKNAEQLHKWVLDQIYEMNTDIRKTIKEIREGTSKDPLHSSTKTLNEIRKDLTCSE